MFHFSFQAFGGTAVLGPDLDNKTQVEVMCVTSRREIIKEMHDWPPSFPLASVPNDALSRECPSSRRPVIWRTAPSPSGHYTR